MSRLVPALLLGLLPLACAPVCPDPYDCTGTLNITLENASLVDDGYRVEADLPDGTSAVAFDIVAGLAQVPEDSPVSAELVGGDLALVFLLGPAQTPETVPVRLYEGDGELSFDGTAEPGYIQVSPAKGGGGCGDYCRTGEAWLDMAEDG